MARDLIPPPSPAGRTLRRSGGVAEPDRAAARAPALPAEPAQQPGVPPSPFRNRSVSWSARLRGVFVAAAMVAARDLVGGSDTGAKRGWPRTGRSWQPSDSSIEAGAVEIAEKVGVEYM